MSPKYIDSPTDNVIVAGSPEGRKDKGNNSVSNLRSSSWELSFVLLTCVMVHVLFGLDSVRDVLFVGSVR